MLEIEIEKLTGAPADQEANSTIHQEVDLPAAPTRIYEILLGARQFRAFTGQAAKIQARPGGAFTLFGGLVDGRNVELVQDRRIVQAWRFASWPEGVYSIVRLELTPRGSETRLLLDHTGFAEDQQDLLREGWQSMYWEPLRKYLKA
jgi:activator of HSP90 ATPase